MRQKRCCLKRLGLVLVLMAAAGCGHPGTPVPFVLAPSPAPQTDYFVQPGDALDIRFYYHPDHNLEATVRPDGKFLLPLIGEVQASGSTPAQLADVIGREYAVSLRDPRVSVSVKNVFHGPVYVSGEVQRSGVVRLQQGTTVMQAIFEAGGFRDTADLQHVVLLRRIEAGQFGYRELNMQKVLSGETPSENLLLSQDDMLFIPKTGIAMANLWVDQYIRGMLPFGGGGIPIRPLPTVGP